MMKIGVEFLMELTLKGVCDVQKIPGARGYFLAFIKCRILINPCGL
ncbi:hypothetical protein M2444_004207 [Paenibacillus sp. PastF-3]|nr:hypothetical protein [Paenibacillus sp. PastF-3]